MDNSASPAPERRCKPRQDAKIFVDLTPFDCIYAKDVNALTYDYSDDGIGLLTYQPYAVGTDLAISICGQRVASGRIVNIKNGTSQGMVRLGIQLLKKQPVWPL